VFKAGELTIRTGSLIDGDRAFPCSAVTDVSEVQLSASRRVGGTALPGYCTGRFWHPETGTVWEAGNCSSRELLMAVASERWPILITPPDVQEFRALLKAPRNIAIALPAGDTGSVRALAGAMAMGIVLVAVLLMATFLVAPRRLLYGVGGGELVVRTLFRRRSWALRYLNVCSYVPNRPARIIGSSFPGYYTGMFREQGRSLLVYATDLAKGVLLEGTQRIYLSPDDLEGFLAVLIAEGARRGTRDEV
jgi:hypothetical protein